jgi:hypothetical protein
MFIIKKIKRKIKRNIKKVITAIIASILASTGITIKAQAIDDNIIMTATNQYLIRGEEMLTKFLESNNDGFWGHRFKGDEYTIGHIPNYIEAFKRHTASFYTYKNYEHKRHYDEVSYLWWDETEEDRGTYLVEDFYNGTFGNETVALFDKKDEHNTYIDDTYYLLGEDRIKITNYGKTVSQMLADSIDIGNKNYLNVLTPIDITDEDGLLKAWDVSDSTDLKEMYLVRILSPWNIEKDYKTNVSSDCFMVEIFSGYTARNSFTKLYTFVYWGHVGDKEYWMDSAGWKELSNSHRDGSIKKDSRYIFRARTPEGGFYERFKYESIVRDLVDEMEMECMKQVEKYRREVANHDDLWVYLTEEHDSWQLKLY